MNKKLIRDLIQSKIIKISRICDLICIEFETREQKEVYLHIQSFFRIIRNKKIILSSEDMYRCGEKCNSEQFEWDIPGNSIFDECLINNKDLYQYQLLNVKFTKYGDVRFLFENNIIIQIMIDTTCIEEKYRIFDSNAIIVKESGEVENIHEELKTKK